MIKTKTDAWLPKRPSVVLTIYAIVSWGLPKR